MTMNLMQTHLGMMISDIMLMKVMATLVAGCLLSITIPAAAAILRILACKPLETLSLELWCKS